jgi:hypothetical protein
MATLQTPADIAATYIDDVAIRDSLTTDITDWYNAKIVGIKTAFKTVITQMGSPTTEALLLAIDNLQILEEES